MCIRVMLSVFVCVLSMWMSPVFGWGYAKEWTQRMNNFELLAQVKQQVETVKQARRQLEELKRQAERLDSHIQDEDFIEAFVTIYGVYKDNEYLAGVGSDLMRNYERQSPSYGGYLRDRGYSFDQYSDWEKRNRQNIGNSLSVVNLTYDQALTRSQLLRNLQLQNRDVVSRDAMIQAGNDIAIMQAQETQMLGNLVREQVRMQAEYGVMQDKQLRSARIENVRQTGVEDSSEQWLDDWRKEALEREKGSGRRSIGR